MTTELTKLREALRRVKYEAVSLADAQVIALEALTTSQPAQAGADEVFLPRRLAATHKLTQLGYRYDHMQGQWLPTQPAAQATPAPVRLAGSVHEDNARILQNILDELRMILGLKYGESIVAAVRALTATPDVPETDFGNMAPQQAAGEPVAWMNDEGDVELSHKSWMSSVWKPLVFANTHPAPGVPENVQRNAARWEEVLRQVGADRQCGGFRFTLYNLRPIPGSNPMQGAVCQHFTQAVDAALAAAQAKGGEQ